MKVYGCGGGCDWMSRAPTMEELIPKVYLHVQKVHNAPNPITPDIHAILLTCIRDD